jgi:hypothetical protein
MDVDMKKLKYNFILSRTNVDVLHMYMIVRLALTWPTCGGCLVGIVRLRTKGHGV